MGIKGGVIGLVIGVLVLTILHLNYDSTHPFGSAPIVGEYHSIAAESLFFDAFLFVFLWLGRQYDKAIFYSRKSDEFARLSLTGRDLRESEESYRSLVELSPEPIAVLCQGTIVYTNPAGARQLGAEDSTALIGKTLWELVHPDDYSAAACQVAKIMQEQQETRLFEWRFLRLDGKMVEVEIKLLYTTYLGKPAVQFLWRDITTQKKADRDLLAAQQELKDVLRYQQGATFKFKKKGTDFIHTLCDGELCYEPGIVHPDQIVGQTLEDFFPPDLASFIKSFYDHAWDSGEIVTYEVIFSGKTFFNTLRPMMQDGKVIEVIGLCTEITAIKEAEKELRQTKELLESIISSTTDAVHVLDKDGRSIQVNKAFERMYGWSKEEMLGKGSMIIPFSILNEEVLDLYEKVMAGGHVSGYETKRRCKNGKLLDISVTASPIQDPNGEIIGAVAISRDISERKQTEDYMRKSEKLAVVGQLAAGVAHEIRNPLTSLKGFLQLLQRNNKENIYFDLMLSELERINEIVGEFLVIAKPQPLKFKRNNLISILQNIISMLESQAILNNVQIATEWESIGEIDIECDANQLKQVFINILKNGIEAMHEGGQIIVSAVKPEPGRVAICFADQGQGMPEDRIPHLGEPFYTTKEKGTGLGLMVSFRIIEDHGGAVRISSTVGKGTVFEISLPAE